MKLQRTSLLKIILLEESLAPWKTTSLNNFSLKTFVCTELKLLGQRQETSYPLLWILLPRQSAETLTLNSESLVNMLLSDKNLMPWKCASKAHWQCVPPSEHDQKKTEVPLQFCLMERWSVRKSWDNAMQIPAHTPSCYASSKISRNNEITQSTAKASAAFQTLKQNS